MADKEKKGLFGNLADQMKDAIEQSRESAEAKPTAPAPGNVIGQMMERLHDIQEKQEEAASSSVSNAVNVIKDAQEAAKEAREKAEAQSAATNNAVADALRQAQEAAKAQEVAKAEAAKAEAAKAEAAAEQRYTVQGGDTLGKISARFYGDAAQWRRIYEANRAIIGNNPDVISVGQEFVIPDASTPLPVQRTYTVRSGDTMRAIAQRFYGDEMQWKRIYQANRDRIPNPDVIHVGQEFIIPE
ncbi:LysM peptidoglycan-binding domain-containing protein [Herpetosiphon sp.]|uniref:Peptidoglycan-binding LysM n=1 Tax=Herpetosiphon aurantiacus (strain ATCC 23779 / DSM 785 / 114-95) TaxID=316274 RepID=A9B6I2_HERA2|nr:LysM peptidoglycan-binding domain-containing protein [Herpetosiphon sp.]ABX02885.1 Peptidoglycan-binding LysM [Herpetosiphon aurantiacus DSM 785]